MHYITYTYTHIFITCTCMCITHMHMHYTHMYMHSTVQAHPYLLQCTCMCITCTYHMCITCTFSRMHAGMHVHTTHSISLYACTHAYMCTADTTIPHTPHALFHKEQMHDTNLVTTIPHLHSHTLII